MNRENGKNFEHGIEQFFGYHSKKPPEVGPWSILNTNSLY
jgi:hypothetical protein